MAGKSSAGRKTPTLTLRLKQPPVDIIDLCDDDTSQPGVTSATASQGSPSRAKNSSTVSSDTTSGISNSVNGVTNKAQNGTAEAPSVSEVRADSVPLKNADATTSEPVGNRRVANTPPDRDKPDGDFKLPITRDTAASVKDSSNNIIANGASDNETKSRNSSPNPNGDNGRKTAESTSTSQKRQRDVQDTRHTTATKKPRSTAASTKALSGTSPDIGCTQRSPTRSQKMQEQNSIQASREERINFRSGQRAIIRAQDQQRHTGTGTLQDVHVPQQKDAKAEYNVSQSAGVRSTTPLPKIKPKKEEEVPVTISDNPDYSRIFSMLKECAQRWQKADGLFKAEAAQTISGDNSLAERAKACLYTHRMFSELDQLGKVRLRLSTAIRREPGYDSWAISDEERTKNLPPNDFYKSICFHITEAMKWESDHFEALGRELESLTPAISGKDQTLSERDKAREKMVHLLKNQTRIEHLSRALRKFSEALHTGEVCKHECSKANDDSWYSAVRPPEPTADSKISVEKATAPPTTSKPTATAQALQKAPVQAAIESQIASESLEAISQNSVALEDRRRALSEDPSGLHPSMVATSVSRSASVLGNGSLARDRPSRHSRTVSEDIAAPMPPVSRSASVLSNGSLGKDRPVGHLRTVSTGAIEPSAADNPNPHPHPERPLAYKPASSKKGASSMTPAELKRLERFGKAKEYLWEDPVHKHKDFADWVQNIGIKRSSGHGTVLRLKELKREQPNFFEALEKSTNKQELKDATVDIIKHFCNAEGKINSEVRPPLCNVLYVKNLIPDIETRGSAIMDISEWRTLFYEWWKEVTEVPNAKEK